MADPVRAAMTISFATASGLGGAAAAADVSLFDVHGALRTIANGVFDAGYRRRCGTARTAGRKIAAVSLHPLAAAGT
jgi:hypothetical protein